MKIKHILTSLVAVCALAIGCTKEQKVTLLDEIQVSQSIVALGDTPTTVEVTAKNNWEIDIKEEDIPSWVKITPLSGQAGTTKLTFEKGEPSDKAYESLSLTLKCGEKSLRLLVQMGDPKPINTEDDPWTPDEAIEYFKANGTGASFFVKGVVKTSKIDTGYGNAEFYLLENDPEYDFEFYRCLDLKEEKFTKADKVKAGDTIIGFGTLTVYKNTVEFAQGCYLTKIIKSEIEFKTPAELNAKKEGDVLQAKLVVTGNDFRFKINADWLSITNIETIPATYDDRGRIVDPQMTLVDIFVDSNIGGSREGKIDFMSGTSMVTATIKQEGSITAVTVAEFLAAEVGAAQYKLSGFITDRTDLAGHKFDLVNYGNFDLTDATGNAYVYGVGANGDIATYGVKEGDIIEIIGTRGDYKGTPQVAGGQYVSHKSVTPATAAQVNALADDDKNDPKNYVRVTGKVTNGTATPGHKFDLETYGNFDLVDESGSLYVYGVSTGWNGETKKFGTLGVKEGDIITLVGYKTSYNGTNELVGMYISHEAGQSEVSLKETSWYYFVPGDSDGGKMAFSFVDDTNCFMVNGDKTGWWWGPDYGNFDGVYTFDPATKSGNINFTELGIVFGLSLNAEGHLIVDATSAEMGTFELEQGEFFTEPESGAVTIDLTAQGYENAQEVAMVESGSVVVTFDKGTGSNTPKYYTSGNAVRVYANGTVTVSNTQAISEISFEFGYGDGTNEITTETGSFDGTTWTGSAASVTFTVNGTSGHRRIAKITVK